MNHPKFMLLLEVIERSKNKIKEFEDLTCEEDKYRLLNAIADSAINDKTVIISYDGSRNGTILENWVSANKNLYYGNDEVREFWTSLLRDYFNDPEEEKF